MNTHSLAEIAQRLRALRRKTITEIARQLSLDRSSLSLWFGGKQRVVSLENQKRICEFLGWRLGYLIPSYMHMWRINREDDVDALRLGLGQFIDPEHEKYRISTARYENGKIGFLIFKARKGGMGTLIRLAVAPEFVDVVLSELKAAGEWAISQEVTEREFQAIWASDTTDISPNDYFRDFEPGGFLKSAMEWESDLWCTEGYLAFMNAQEEIRPEDNSDVTKEDTFEEKVEAYLASDSVDIEDVVAQQAQDDLWRPLIRKLQGQGLSPQEVEAILRPVLDLLCRSQTKGNRRNRPKSRARSD